MHCNNKTKTIMATPKRLHMTKKSAEAEIKRIQSIDCTWNDLRVYKLPKGRKNRFWIGTYMEWLNK